MSEEDLKESLTFYVDSPMKISLKKYIIHTPYLSMWEVKDGLIIHYPEWEPLFKEKGYEVNYRDVDKEVERNFRIFRQAYNGFSDLRYKHLPPSVDVFRQFVELHNRLKKIEPFNFTAFVEDERILKQENEIK